MPDQEIALSRRPTSHLRALAAAVVAGLVLAACGGEEPAPPSVDGEPDAPASPSAEPAPTVHVVTTTGILGDIVGEIVGDAGEVTVIMPPGVDPHSFQASAADAVLLRRADLVVVNGLDLEEALLDVLEAAREDGVRVFEVADQLDPIEYGAHQADAHEDGHGHEEDDHAHEEDDHAHEDGHGEEDDHGHDHGSHDPHVWFDPVRMAEGVRLIAAELEDLAPSGAWGSRADAYAAELLAVHEELESIFAELPDERRVLVTNHDSLGYLADRYGFRVLGTVIPGSTTQAEADPRSFAALVEVVRETGVPAVFAETIDSTRLAEQLAAEVGRADHELAVVTLYTGSLGPQGSGAETYLAMLVTNARLIADALA
jgi:zinc/manganese transport system substrate-binding protein